MDFSFSEEQRDVQNLARQILTEQVTVERQVACEKAGERFDRALWAQLAEAGLLGVAISENYGGMNFGLTELCFFIEEVGRTIAPVPVVPVLVSAALPIQRFGSDAQKARFLPGIVTGEVLVTAALAEALNDNPATPVLTTAVAQGSGYVVSGVKTLVPFAAQSQRVLLSAKTDQGVVVLLVDPNAQGVTITAQNATNKEPTYEVALSQVQVGAEDVLAASNGADVMQWIGERTTAAYCAMMTGIADKMMRTTASYTSERHQFGVPVATFQAVGHRMANCYIDIEAQRLVSQQAISLLDSELDATVEVAIAKIWTGDCGHRTSYAAQHCHGGMGIDKDYPMWRYYIWARQIEMILGNSAATLAALGDQIAAGKGLAG